MKLHSTVDFCLVGAGPRALVLLQHIASCVLAEGSQRLYIKLVDPCSSPGAGRTYRHDQSEIYRMNNDVGDFTAFTADFEQAFPEKSLSLAGWMRREKIAFDAALPRRVVGQYLSYAMKTVVGCTQKIMDVEFIEQTATKIIDRKTGFDVLTSDGLVSTKCLAILTGHGIFKNENWRKSLRWLPTSSRAEDPGSGSGSGSGARSEPVKFAIVVEGMALTAIDVCIGLTHGRRLHIDESSAYPQQSQRFQVPEKIALKSRTGRMIIPKAALTAPIQLVVDSILADYCHLPAIKPIRNVKLSLTSAFIARVFIAADAIALALSEKEHNTKAWFSHTWPTVNFQQSLSMGDNIVRGRFSDDSSATCAASIGIAFRALQNHMNAKSDHGLLCAEDRSAYKCFCLSMEPIAFGPTAAVFKEFIKLVRRGVVCDIHEFDAEEYEQIIEIKAHIPGPHNQYDDAIFQSLKSQHLISHDPATGAARTTHSGSAIRHDDSVSRGLGVFSRASEHWITGMDSLNAIDSADMKKWARASVSGLELKATEGRAHQALPSSKRQKLPYHAQGQL